MTIRFPGNANDLVRSLENEIADNDAAIAARREAIEKLLDATERRGETRMAADDDCRADGYFAEIERLTAANRRKEAALVRAQEIADEERANESRLDTRISTGAGSTARTSPRTASLSIGRNERTYNRGRDIEAGFVNQPGGNFLIDVGRAYLGDVMANERLSRHMREEYVERPWLEERSSSTVNFAGLVVPQYLVDDAAPAVSAARPLADVMHQRELPSDGLSVNISRITTPTAAGLQTTENTTVTTQDIDDTLLTLPVLTAAGYSQLFRQAVERGVLTEDVTVADLLKRVAVALDSTLLSQTVTGLAATATSQTYTNATVDTTAIPAAWKQMIQAQNSVETTMLAQASPSHFVMHPRRWNWFCAAVSSSWPVISGTNVVPPQSWGNATHERLRPRGSRGPA